MSRVSLSELFDSERTLVRSINIIPFHSIMEYMSGRTASLKEFAFSNVVGNILILVPLGLEYLYTIAFILVIAALVQFVEMFIKKSSPSLYQALGVYLPLITTNCAVLGCAVTNMQSGYNFIESIVNGIGGAGGFTFAIVLFAGIRERIEFNDIPKAFEGFPLALIGAGLMSVSFLGFSGLIKL